MQSPLLSMLIFILYINVNFVHIICDNRIHSRKKQSMWEIKFKLQVKLWTTSQYVILYVAVIYNTNISVVKNIYSRWYSIVYLVQAKVLRPAAQHWMISTDDWQTRWKSVSSLKDIDQICITGVHPSRWCIYIYIYIIF